MTWVREYQCNHNCIVLLHISDTQSLGFSNCHQAKQSNGFYQQKVGKNVQKSSCGTADALSEELVNWQMNEQTNKQMNKTAVPHSPWWLVYSYQLNIKIHWCLSTNADQHQFLEGVVFQSKAVVYYRRLKRLEAVRTPVFCSKLYFVLYFKIYQDVV